MKNIQIICCLAIFLVVPAVTQGQQGFVVFGGSVSGATAKVHYSGGLVGYQVINQNGLKATAGNQQPAGCTDAGSDNPEPGHIYDDGSCTYNLLTGCTNPVADNYSPTAINDDGSCTFDNVTGCTNAQADNYEPQNLFDDGSCVFSGCTYTAASNFDPQATNDDGSCLFEPCANCTGDLNGDLIVSFSDLSLFLSVYGTVCP